MITYANKLCEKCGLDKSDYGTGSCHVPTFFLSDLELQLVEPPEKPEAKKSWQQQQKEKPKFLRQKNN